MLNVNHTNACNGWTKGQRLRSQVSVQAVSPCWFLQSVADCKKTGVWPVLTIPLAGLCFKLDYQDWEKRQQLETFRKKRNLLLYLPSQSPRSKGHLKSLLKMVMKTRGCRDYCNCVFLVRLSRNSQCAGYFIVVLSKHFTRTKHQVTIINARITGAQSVHPTVPGPHSAVVFISLGWKPWRIEPACNRPQLRPTTCSALVQNLVLLGPLLVKSPLMHAVYSLYYSIILCPWT